MTDLPETDLQRAQQALREAKDARDALLDARNAEINAARDQIKAAWAERLATSDAAVRLAEAKVAAAKLAQPRHPWEGRKVTKQDLRRSRSYWGPSQKVTIYGIVETRTADTQFPGNLSGWRLPDLGQPFVRLIRANGTLGSKIASMAGWKLADEQD